MEDFNIAEQLRWLEELPFVPLRQARMQPEVADVAATVAAEIRKANLPARLPAGAKVAVAVGSRGIGQLFEIAQATIGTLKALGFSPFVVAAMGSHGGATAEGQRNLLAEYGITPERLGVPVRTEMDVVRLGTNELGEPVWWDKNALAADAVLTISRIKAHTDFVGAYESGIVKMLVIGLGKREGASTHHQYGVRGLRDVIPASIPVVLAQRKFVLGLGIVENAAGRPALIQGVLPDELLAMEPKLLAQAKELAGKLPFAELDLLIVGELGKNYSGTGMDVHVLGRHFVEGEPEPWKPKVTRIGVLDLSPESDGNAVGAGLADLTTVRLLAKTNDQKTRMNYLTSCFLLRAKTPYAFPTDRECVAAGLRTCWQPKRAALKAAVIPNTLELNRVWATPAAAATAPELKPDGEPAPLPFAADGSLEQKRLFPESWQGRRVLPKANASGRLSWPICSLLLFVATPAEEEALKDQANQLHLEFRNDPVLKRRLQGHGLSEQVWSLGTIGGETVVAVGCSRHEGKAVMGPHGRLGSAARAMRYLAATGAQGIIQVGMGFGIDRKWQNLGDVLVSNSLVPYDNRDVRPCTDAPGYVNDYSKRIVEPARPALVERCLREKVRTEFTFKVYVGALLSGAARIHCAKFRDELRGAMPHGDDPIVGGEMEGVGLLAAAVKADDPVWCVVKGISDFADEQRDEDIKLGRALAAKNAAHFVLSSLLNDAKDL